MNPTCNVEVLPTIDINSPAIQRLKKQLRHCLRMAADSHTSMGAQVWMQTAQEIIENINWQTGHDTWEIGG